MLHDELEQLERTVLEMVVQALTDYSDQAVEIFREETDQPQDIAEDVTEKPLTRWAYRALTNAFTGK